MSSVQPKLQRKNGTLGFDWHPIVEWTLNDVLDYLQESGFQLHEAYTKYNMSRVSCSSCILSSWADLKASAKCADNQPVYIELIGLEIQSTFAFQDSKWLGDAAPDILPIEMREALAQAKLRAMRRQAAEAQIPKHLLYTKGWPTVIPTHAEAGLLGDVRREVAQAVSIAIEYTSPDAIIERYTDLFSQRRYKEMSHVPAIA